MFSAYTRLRIISLAKKGYKAPAIAQLLADENI